MNGLTLYFVFITIGFLWAVMGIMIWRVTQMERDFKNMADAILALDDCIKRLRLRRRQPVIMQDNDA